MPKAIKPQVNGAAIDEKLTEKIVATGITASELAMVTQAGGPLKLLALVSFLISRMMLDVGGKTLAIQELLTQHGAALTGRFLQGSTTGNQRCHSEAGASMQRPTGILEGHLPARGHCSPPGRNPDRGGRETRMKNRAPEIVPYRGARAFARKRDDAGRFIKARTNGQKKKDPQSTMNLPTGISTSLMRILRPQAGFRWLLPSVANITPQYVEMVLRGALVGNHVQQWELFDLMLDTWPELAGCQQVLLYGIQRRDLIFEAYREQDEQPTPDAIDREKLVSAALRGMQPVAGNDENALYGTIADIIDGWFRGLTVLEVDWQMLNTPKLGSIIAPRATYWVHPTYFGFNSAGVLGLRAISTSQSSVYRQGDTQDFPPDKFLIAIHKAKSGTALGGAMLRPLTWWWCAANFSSEWLLNFAQVFGLPFRWANYAQGSPQETINAICDMLTNMGSAGWAAFPQGTTLELKESARAGGRYSPQADLLDRADGYVRMLILGQTMTGGTMQGGRGGQAFGKIEMEVKQDRLDASCKFAANVINLQLIPSILRLNYGDMEQAPTCRFLEEEEGTLEDAQRDQIVATIGGQIPLSYLSSKYSIPSPNPGEELAHAPVVAPKPFGGGGDGQQMDQMQAKLRKILAIKDDALFGRELQHFAEKITK
jgi:phage gp29-like protein